MAACLRANRGSLRAIHQITQPAYGYIVTDIIDPRPTNDDYMQHQFAKKIQEFVDFGGDQQLAAAIANTVAQQAPVLNQCPQSALCHNDMHEGNVLVRQRGDGWQMQGFVDVENAIAADPMLDVAKTEYYSIRGDQDKIAGLVTGYGTAMAEHGTAYPLPALPRA